MIEAEFQSIYAGEDYLLIVSLLTKLILICNIYTFFGGYLMSLSEVLLYFLLFSLISCYFLLDDDDEREIKSLCLQAECLINKI